MTAFGDELATFDLNGFPSPFTGRRMKVLEDATIVSVIGYGSGDRQTPDSIVGFASPLGYASCSTRGGDSSAPVVDKDGYLLGFWTHGDGHSFGRFEPVTKEMIEFAKSGKNALHVGLDFQSGPHHQKK